MAGGQLTSTSLTIRESFVVPLNSLRIADLATSFYYGGTVGNEIGMSDPVFMKKYGKELEQDSGKWIDSSVWHGKAHTWEKVEWLIEQVCPLLRLMRDSV